MRTLLRFVLVSLFLLSCSDPGAAGKSAAAEKPQPVPATPAQVNPAAPAQEEGGEAVDQDRTQREAAPKPAPTPEAPVREPVLAGSWYPGEAGQLTAAIDGWMADAPSLPEGSYPIAIIAPHAGMQFSGKTAAAAYASLRGRTYGRVFLLAPSHRKAFRGVAVGDFLCYRTPLGCVPVDRAELEHLKGRPWAFPDRSAHEKEHSLEIQLPLLQRALGDTPWKLVPLLLGELSVDDLKTVAADLAGRIGPGDLLVASSDFTHWGSSYSYMGPPGQEFTPENAQEKLSGMLDQAFAAIRNKDVQAFVGHIQQTEDTICGFRPITVLLGALPHEATAIRMASDTSGRMTGDSSASVSYLSVVFSGLWPYNGVGFPNPLAQDQKDALLRLARKTVDTWVKERRKIEFSEAGVEKSGRFAELQGAFVTLQKDGDLRGCIGTIVPVKSLADSIRDNAVNAASFDPRFPEVQASELPQIKVEVSVLGTPVTIPSLKDFVLGRDGIILSKGGRSAVFLPQVAPEQGWTVEDTLNFLNRKAGLPQGAWKSGAEYQTFQAIVFHEK